MPFRALAWPVTERMIRPAARLLLPLLLLLCGSALPLRAQAVARMHASATVAEPVQATVHGARVESAAGPVRVEVGVDLRGAVAWSVGGGDAARTASAMDAGGCGGWTGGTDGPAARDDDPATPRPLQRLTAVVRCAAPAAGELHPRPLEVRVMAVN